MNKPASGAFFVAAFFFGVVASRPAGQKIDRAGPVAGETKSTERDIRSLSEDQRKARLEELVRLPAASRMDRIEIQRHLAVLPAPALESLCRATVRDTWEGDLTDDERATLALRAAAIHEWSLRDPFAFLQEMPEAYDLERSFAWQEAAKSDPSRANELATSTSRGLGFHERTSLLKGLAEGDPALAFRAAREMSDEDFGYTDLDDIAGGFDDPGMRLKWADVVFERFGVKKQPDLYQIFRMVAEEDPDLLEQSEHLQVVAEYRESVRRTVGEQKLKNMPPGSPVPYPKDGSGYAGWELEGRRLERWFAHDPAAVREWLDEAPDPEMRGNLLAAIAGAASITDLESLDRVVEMFPAAEDRNSLIKAATYFLSDGDFATRASLRGFVGRYPDAKDFVKRPQMLDP